jgi:hypothetical protein
VVQILSPDFCLVEYSPIRMPPNWAVDVFVDKISRDLTAHGEITSTSTRDFSVVRGSRRTKCLHRSVSCRDLRDYTKHSKPVLEAGVESVYPAVFVVGMGVGDRNIVVKPKLLCSGVCLPQDIRPH